jgi:hypothetical protein
MVIMHPVVVDSPHQIEEGTSLPWRQAGNTIKYNMSPPDTKLVNPSIKYSRTEYGPHGTSYLKL